MFPVLGTVERSDRACTNLLGGKIIILVEGGGLALTAPQTFIEYLDSADDYFESSIYNVFVKALRILAMVITLVVSPLYIAIVAYHPDILPPIYILSIAQARATVPFNAFTETLLMEVLAGILREASIRLPKQVGAAVGIVGTIVIGQAAVAAGLVSPLLVIIISLSLMCSFAAPNYSITNALHILKFFLLILSGLLGLFGFVIGTIAISINMISVSSFGVPYLKPFAPFHLQGIFNFFLGNTGSEKDPKLSKTENKN